jgi:hypothetical protein
LQRSRALIATAAVLVHLDEADIRRRRRGTGTNAERGVESARDDSPPRSAEAQRWCGSTTRPSLLFLRLIVSLAALLAMIVLVTIVTGVSGEIALSYGY